VGLALAAGVGLGVAAAAIVAVGKIGVALGWGVGDDVALGAGSKAALRLADAMEFGLLETKRTLICWVGSNHVAVNIGVK